MNNEEIHTVVIGITGAIGSGKSTVADLLRDKGYKVISTDDLAKHLMATDDVLKEKLIKAFGKETYSDKGELNRKHLSDIVFAPGQEKQLEKLNSIVHPAVIEEMINISEEAEETGEKLLFFESALIFEAGLEEGFDYIIMVDAPEDAIIKRAKERTGLPEEAIRSRFKNQIHPEEKKRASDFVIDNAGTTEDLNRSLEFLLPIIETLPPKEVDEDEEE